MAESFRLLVNAGHGAPVHPTAGNDHTLTVFAPKATFATVRLSCFLDPVDLQSMGLWEWLEEQGLATPALAAIARSGRHYMFTPYRELVIVHAVRQPLTPPQFTKPHISRGYGKTFALLSDTIKVDWKSSIKVDVLSKWEEPFDDGVNPVGSVEIAHNAPVGEIPLATVQPPPLSVKTPAPGLRHDFGDTKHREVFYEAQATTRFLEYFVQTEKVALHGTAPDPRQRRRARHGRDDRQESRHPGCHVPADRRLHRGRRRRDDRAHRDERHQAAQRGRPRRRELRTSAGDPLEPREGRAACQADRVPVVGPELGPASRPGRALRAAAVRVRHRHDADGRQEPPRRQCRARLPRAPLVVLR